jgi:hypothetical protein
VRRWVTIVVACAFLAAACGGEEGGGVSGPPTAEARIGLIEWEVTSSAGALLDSRVTLVVTNAGSTAHDLRVRGDGVSARTPLLSPGQRATLTVDARGQRQLELWCGVAGHRAEGMHRTVPVRGEKRSS